MAPNRVPIRRANTESSTYFLRRFRPSRSTMPAQRSVPKIRRALERTGEVIGSHDLQIAAIALHHNLTLVTHNTREFGRTPSLRLDDWES